MSRNQYLLNPIQSHTASSNTKGQISKRLVFKRAQAFHLKQIVKEHILFVFSGL